jgi:hypothetical protein
MKRSGKKESSSRPGNRKGVKSKSNLDESISKKRSPFKRSDKGTRKKSSAKVTKVRTRNTSKARSKKSSIRVRSEKSGLRKPKGSSRPLKRSFRNQTSKRRAKKRVIRVLGQGQFSVGSETLRRLNAIDNSIVRRFEKNNLTDDEFKIKIEQLGGIVTKEGKRLDPKKIISSDIILPSSDLTIEEASKIFHGEGIIPGLD